MRKEYFIPSTFEPEAWFLPRRQIWTESNIKRQVNSSEINLIDWNNTHYHFVGHVYTHNLQPASRARYVIRVHDIHSPPSTATCKNKQIDGDISVPTPTTIYQERKGKGNGGVGYLVDGTVIVQTSLRGHLPDRDAEQRSSETRASSP